ncbi:ATP-dependent helicase [Clostridium botulinum]|uniref:DNA 3'-5' helicase n=1 Tax=Clostridium botulinum TaxID=1491 RepID=A0A6B4JJ27_CLOBO|nr:ATP-dependent helicase [Clostridium botulinum]EES48312.1 helicase, UvrD/REP family [Clostridium botulinum E1 str. 'BoNT E Beluga']MBY6759953.1 ATP-dependent helicase [Clostridium botulinum]MBY6918863.1 ATP-dependent helicase [Clostridium botulinum]MCR1129949.1 ATP-dependent helicase [Clostridium botulinum]NFJ56665.1 ATP-dependent helicase [Clostridium botulinum]
MYNLDIYQNKAVITEDKNALIIAAPGSGKTTVIINRIYYLVDKLKISNGRIIVITFTKAAAKNMKERYENRFKQNTSPFFGTFHGLFYKILLRTGKNIDIIDGSIINKLIKKVLTKYFDDINEDKIKEVLNNISIYKTSRIKLYEFRPSISREIFEEALECYEHYKKENGKMDFDDLAIEALDLLESNEKALIYYRKLFKYILVDEFQDCDELQIEFLKLINDGEDNSLFAVGDEDQCIYSFRGSKPMYMVTFDKMFKDSKKHYLSINYRSKDNIVEKSKKLIKFNKERNNKEILSNKKDDGIIKFYTPYNEKSQGDILANLVKNEKKYNINYEENAILYRTNMEAMSVIDAFTKNHIPFRLLDRQYNFFEHFICKDLIAYLKLVVNPFDKESFIKIINKPFRYISKHNIDYVRNYTIQENLFNILINKEDTPPFQRKNLDELKKDFNYLNKISLGSAISYIVMDLEYIDYLKSYCEKFSQNLEDLEEVIEEFKLSAEGFKNIFDFLAHIENVSNEIEVSKNKNQREGVILSTIHGVKGMEFKNVYLVNCNEDTIPHSSSKEENIEEERRLFYVGITRAIDNLYLFAPKNRRGQLKEISRFICESEFDKLPKDTYGYKVDDNISQKTYGLGKIKSIEDDKVIISFEDGVNRSFSLKVLAENDLIQKIT